MEAGTSGRTSALLKRPQGTDATKMTAFTSSPETFTIPATTIVTATVTHISTLPNDVAMDSAGIRLPEAQIVRFNERACRNVSLHLHA